MINCRRLAAGLAGARSSSITLLSVRTARKAITKSSLDPEVMNVTVTRGQAQAERLANVAIQHPMGERQ